MSRNRIFAKIKSRLTPKVATGAFLDRDPYFLIFLQRALPMRLPKL